MSSVDSSFMVNSSSDKEFDLHEKEEMCAYKVQKELNPKQKQCSHGVLLNPALVTIFVLWLGLFFIGRFPFFIFLTLKGHHVLLLNEKMRKVSTRKRRTDEKEIRGQTCDS